jgi:hypothetical protein
LSARSANDEHFHSRSSRDPDHHRFASVRAAGAAMTERLVTRIFWTVVLTLDFGWVLLALSIYSAKSGIYPQ